MKSNPATNTRSWREAVSARFLPDGCVVDLLGLLCLGRRLLRLLHAARLRLWDSARLRL